MIYTIIIPAYNATKFIKHPLDSLSSQTIDKNEFEVLIIDDGSTDIKELTKIVSLYKKRIKNLKLISKKNGNWGSVINYVKKNKLCQGKYITILDSDDWFEVNMLSYFKEHNEDILISQIKWLKGKRSRKPKMFLRGFGNIKKETAFTPFSMPQGKFYKKELFYSMVDLKEGVSYQDTVLYNDLLSKSESIFTTKKRLVIWWSDREGNSTTEVWDERRAITWISTCQRILNLPNRNDESMSWVLMYLFELSRNYKGKLDTKLLGFDPKLVKMKWLYFGSRNLIKKIFLFKTKRFWK